MRHLSHNAKNGNQDGAASNEEGACKTTIVKLGLMRVLKYEPKRT